MRRGGIVRAACIGGVGLAAMTSAVAHAQTQPSRPEAGAPSTGAQVSEVVVTANKRSERLQDVANSVSAVSGAELTRTQTLDLQDIQYKVPGLSLTQGVLGATSQIILRGENSGGAGATVATLVDDVPLTFSGGITDGGYLSADFDTYDMQRIEVLRGPQGTLYGATAEGGLIKYVTNLPDLNRYQAGAEAGALSLAHADSPGASAKGFINIPLMDGKAALRASGFYEYTPGWIDDKLISQTNLNENRRYGGRASLLWRPTQDLSVRVSAFYQRHNAANFSDTVDIVDPGKGWRLADGYNQNHYPTNLAKVILGVYSVNVDYDLHWARFQSISGYATERQFFLQDQTPYVNLFTPNSVINQRQLNGISKINQEFRLSSEPSNSLFSHPFEWQTGLYYTRESVSFDQFYDGLAYPGLQLLPGLQGRVYGGFTPSTYQDVAGYADGTFHFTPKLDLEVGGRISHNDQRLHTAEEGVLGGGSATPVPLANRYQAEWVGTYSVAPRWHINPDVMVYARIASGYRAGGPLIPIAGAPPGLPTSFNSDSTTNYEVGLKGQFFQRKLSADVAAFYIDWQNIQIPQIFLVTIIDSQGNQRVQNYNQTGNGGTAVSQGVEWSLIWTPVRGLTLGTVGAYTDAHLTQDARAIGGVKGEKLAYVPDVSGNLNFNYEWPLRGDYRAFVGGAWAYTGRRFTTIAADPTISHLRIPSYTNVSLQAGVQNGRYTFEVYGKNLGDERGILSYVPGLGLNGGDVATVTRPRVVGVRIAAAF